MLSFIFHRWFQVYILCLKFMNTNIYKGKLRKYRDVRVEQASVRREEEEARRQQEERYPVWIPPQAEELLCADMCTRNPLRPRASGASGCCAAGWSSGWTRRWSLSECTVGNTRGSCAFCQQTFPWACLVDMSWIYYWKNNNITFLVNYSPVSCNDLIHRPVYWPQRKRGLRSLSLPTSVSSSLCRTNSSCPRAQRSSQTQPCLQG